MTDTKRVAIFFQMISPYIMARLNAAAQVCELIVIEGSRRSAAYAWEPLSGDERFERRTLYTDRPIEEADPQEIEARVRAELSEIDPDVVVAGGWSQPDALAMLLWAREHERMAIVMSESNVFDERRNFLREAVKRRVVRQFDAAIVGGHPQEDYVVSLGIDRARVFRGYNVVDNAFFARGADAARADAARLRAQFGLPENYFMVSCRFIAKKNLERLIEAFAHWRSQSIANDWHLVLVGDGPLRPSLEQQASNADVGGVVHFPGFKQYADLPTYYGLAKAFCLVSTVEQWGLVVNEAMASGLPVMVSEKCGCATDLVVTGKNGWVVDPFDVSQMAETMARFAEDPQRLERMGKESRRIISAHDPSAFGNGLAAALNALRNGTAKRISALDRWLLTRLAARSAPTGQ